MVAFYAVEESTFMDVRNEMEKRRRGRRRRREGGEKRSYHS
jgi:hypothetical protein